MKEDEGKSEVLKLQAELCKSLSNPKRLQIIQELRESEKTVSELAERLALKQSNASQHLGVLRKIGLIAYRKQGNAVYYRLVNPKIGVACDLVHEVLAEQLEANRQLSSLFKSEVK